MKRAKNIIIGIGGGKGGVGKSLVSTLFAIKSTEEGKKVLLIDSDLGGSNIHTIMGIKPDKIKWTISNYFMSRELSFEDILVKSDIENLFVACGSQNNYRLVNLPYYLKLRFFKELREKDIDITILDLGSGSSYTTLDFFAFADAGIIVTTVEKTAIENAYRFIKGAFLRRLRFEVKRYGTDIIDDMLKAKDRTSHLKPYQVVDLIMKLYPEIEDRLEEFLKNTKIGIVLNMVDNHQEMFMGKKIETAVRTYLDISVKFLGGLFYLKEIRKCFRNGHSIKNVWNLSVLKNNFNPIYKGIKDIIEK